MLYAVGFIGLFTIGGLTGLFLGNVSVDVPLSDTFFVVGHFHMVMGVAPILVIFGAWVIWRQTADLDPIEARQLDWSALRKLGWEHIKVTFVATFFVLATALALAKASGNPWLRRPAEAFIFVFRGSPLFIQFFVAYQAFVLLPREGIEIFGATLPTAWLSRAWAGALIVLILNTAAYSAEIFHGALRNVPKGDLEAADAYGLSGWARFRRIVWPRRCAGCTPGCG